MKKFINKKVIIYFIIALIFSLFLINWLVFILWNKITFKLVGDKVITIEVYNKYDELGVKALDDKKDISTRVIIDNSKVNVNKIGIYDVVYSMIYNEKEYSITRKVNVIDSKKPELKLIGEEEIIINQGDNYIELGCNAVDNYDEKVNDKIQIINYVKTTERGIYTINYFVTDDSGNSSSITRKVIVKDKDEDISKIDYNDFLYSNRVTSMSYKDDGIYIAGYLKSNNGKFNIKLCKNNKKQCVTYDMNKLDDYYYYGTLSLSNLKNGTYYMWISSINDEKVINKLGDEYRISRAKIGNKLVTFNYDNDNVKIKVEDFKYLYDIVIDPGHGGNDSGAKNSTIDEKRLNLMQSLYEKKRYVEHGLKVLLLREDESYGIVMGNEDWPAVRRKAYALGYYGTVAKITYSNHHNSSEDKKLMGWEIIVPVNANDDDLNLVYNIKESWIKSYPVNEKHIRLYTRNYNTGTIFTKENNEKYYFTDYYAVLRLPYQLFNIKNVLYEGAYLSNYSDFDWYYNEDNWKNLSEEKVKAYVTSLGIKYIPPKQ